MCIYCTPLIVSANVDGFGVDYKGGVMVIQGTLQEVDYIAAQYLHMRPIFAFGVWGSRAFKIFCLCLFGLVALGSVIGLLRNGLSSRELLSVIINLYLPFLFLVWFPYKFRRQFRGQRLLSFASVVEVRDDGLFFKKELSKNLLPWAHIHKWRHSDNIVLVYRAKHIFEVIPKHFFTNPAEFKGFVDILQRNHGDES